MAVADRRIRRRAAALAQDPLLTRELHDVVDSQEIRLVVQVRDQLQLVFDLRLHVDRNAGREAPARADIGLFAQIGRRVVAGRHQFVRILVFEIVEGKRAAPRDAHGFLERAGGVEIGEPETRSQVTLRVRRKLVPAFRHRPADAYARQHVLQRLARADMHQWPAGGHHRHAVARGDAFAHSAVDVVHRTRVQRQRDPCAIAEHSRDPLDLCVEPLLVGWEVGRQDRDAIGQGAQVGERGFRVLDIEGRQAVRAFLAAHATERDEFAEVAVTVPIHCECSEGERGRAVGGRQPEVRADDQRHVRRLRFDVRAHDAGQRAFVCDRDRAVAELRRARHVFLRARRTVQEGEVACDLEFGVGGQGAEIAGVHGGLTEQAVQEEARFAFVAGCRALLVDPVADAVVVLGDEVVARHGLPVLPAAFDALARRHHAQRRAVERSMLAREQRHRLGKQPGSAGQIRRQRRRLRRVAHRHPSSGRLRTVVGHGSRDKHVLGTESRGQQFEQPRVILRCSTGLRKQRVARCGCVLHAASDQANRNHGAGELDVAEPFLDEPREGLLEASGRTQRDFDLGRRDRLTAALVLEQQGERGDVQLLRGEPAGQLQDQPARDEQQRLGVLDLIHQFDARVERWRHFDPVVGRRRGAGDMVEPVKQLRAAALLQSGARQVLQIGQRCAAEILKPVRVASGGRRNDERHACERAAQRSCGQREATAQAAGDHPRGRARRRDGYRRGDAERRDDVAHALAQRADAVEQAQARGHVEHHHGFLGVDDARGELQERIGNAEHELALARGVTLADLRVRRERQHATAAHAGDHAVRTRGAIERHDAAALEHNEPARIVRRRRRRSRPEHFEVEVRQMHADPDLHGGSTKSARETRARTAACRVPVRGASRT